MRKTKRVAIWMAAIAAAAAIGSTAGGAFSSTQAGFGTSPGTRPQAGIGTSPGTGRVLAGVGTSPGARPLAARKAGGTQQEYLLAIPGVRGTGGGHTTSEG
jgi:hypothetical protein